MYNGASPPPRQMGPGQYGQMNQMQQCPPGPPNKQGMMQPQYNGTFPGPQGEGGRGTPDGMMMPPGQVDQMSNRMGGMNISGPQGNMPPQNFGPPNMGGPPQQQMGQNYAGPPQGQRGPPPMGQRPGGPPNFGQPPNSMQGQGQMRGPPPQMGQRPPGTGPRGHPPTSMGGPPRGPTPPSSVVGGPPRGPTPPNSVVGGPPRGPTPPNSVVGGPRSNSMQGQYPPSSMSGPPNMGGPPTSIGGQMPPGPRPSGPPTSMGGQMPPMSMSGPPNSMAGPPSSMSGPSHMGGPPRGPHTSMGGQMPPSSMSGPRPLGGPPSSMGGQMPPNSMAGQGFMPPNSMSGQPGRPPMPGPGSRMPGPPPMMGQNQPPNMMPPQPQTMDTQNRGQQMPGSPPGPGQFPPPPGGQMQPGMPPPPGGQMQPGMPPPPGGQMQPGMPPRPGGPGQPPHMMPPGPNTPDQMGQQQYPPQYNASRPAPQQQQPRRLDPDQMPSPIQVIEDDRRNKSSVFATNGRGLVPPLVTTDFTTEDQGNSNPKFLRSTMYTVPCTNDMLKQINVPFGLVISPFAKLDESRERPPPLVDLGDLGPVRCNRCKAYMCPQMQFTDGGRRFQCCFCSCTTEVPAEYFAHLDHTGRRTDCYDRPELCLGSYEFVATKEYCRDNVFPKPPAIVFMIDVSYPALKSGMVHLVCERLKDDILLNLPRETGMDESEIRVGFATYSNVIHFYNVKGCLAQPQMLVVSDVQDMFVPLVDGFLVKLSESEAVIDSLLEQIPTLFAESQQTETVFGPVIQAGLDALKSSNCVGKLIIFHTSLPIAEAPGKLKNRDDAKLLGTDKEKTVLSPSSSFYTNLGQECVTAGCSVDLFLFPNQYVDLATIGEVSRLTGGQIYKYTYFRADVDGERFIGDLRNNVSRPTAFDAIMRVRTSTGIRPTDFWGNFYMSNTTDVELSVIDSDKSISIEIKHDDKLNESEGAYIQVAVLYTSITGQRRLRILNQSLNCSMMMADIFKNVELDTCMNILAKQAIRNSLQTNPKSVRENLTNQCANILGCYRKNCASPSSAGQLILPEVMKLLPLYTNCVIKSDALQGGIVRTFTPLMAEASDISTDDRNYLMHILNSMGVESSCYFFYPRVLPLHDLDENSTDFPVSVRCSAERLSEDGAYLLENGICLFLWIGHNIDPRWVHEIFGVQSAAQIDIDKNELLELDNPMSIRVRRLINDIRKSRSRCMKLQIVRQRDKLEPWFQHFLVEDRGQNGTASYVEYLCHIHKEIRNLLS